MAGAGRNDPCPCGSGRKFKHCCLSREQTATGITPRDRTEAIEALVKYSRREEFDHIVVESAQRWAGMPDASMQEALQSIFEFETSVEAFFEWLFFDVRLDDGRTLSERFADGRGWTASPRALHYMRVMRDTHWRVYQVREVKTGEGLAVRDLWTKDDLFITERKGSTQLVRWDLLAARVKTHDDGTQQIEGASMALPPRAAKPLMKALRAAHKSFAARHPNDSLEAFFKFAAPHIHDYWYEEVANAPPPTLVTSDGAPLTMSTLVFDVPKAGVALVTLLKQADFEPGERGSAIWMADEPNGRRILGDVRCDKGTLTLTTLSRERATRGRARLVEILGPLAILDEQHQEPGALAREGLDAPAEDDAALPIADVPEVAEWQARKDREWLDLDVPALDGATPREAAKNPRLRSRLRHLLIDIENRQARMAAGSGGGDLAWMWKKLGLRRP